jgi:serine/threonine-protein kinase
VFWELLAGQRLMKGENQGAIVRQILAGPKQGPSELNPAVSKALDAVCLRAIHVQPEERYATAADFAEAIELAAQSARHPIATQRAVAAFVTELKAHASPVDLPPPSESAPRSWAPASLMQRPAKTIDELMARVEAAEDAAGEPLAASATHRAVSSDSIPIEQRRQPKKGGTGLAVLAVLVLLGGAAGWWYLGRPQLGAMSPSPAAAASGSPVDVSSAATVAPPPEPAPAPAAPSTQAEGAPGSDQAPSSNAAPARGAPGRVRPTKGFPAGRTAPTATVYRPKEL